MKKVILFVVLCLLCSCSSKTTETTQKASFGFTSTISSVEIDGHVYLVYKSGYAGGLCHSESCPCKSK